jgi:flagellar protein FliS
MEGIMPYASAGAAYKETKIKTANQGQLIIMLYDGALKNLDEAISIMKKNAGKKNPALIESSGKAIIKAQAIISELSASLDFDAGKEIANRLFSLYAWFAQELLDANITYDAGKLETVRTMLSDLRTSWQDIISKQNSSTHVFNQRPTESAGINFAL